MKNIIKEIIKQQIDLGYHDKTAYWHFKYDKRQFKEMIENYIVSLNKNEIKKMFDLKIKKDNEILIYYNFYSNQFN